MFSQFHFIQSAKLKRLRSVLPAALLALALLGATACGSFAAVPAPQGTATSPSPPTPPPPPPPPSVVVMPGSATGGDLGDNDTVSDTSQCSAVVNNPPVTDDEVSVDGPHWSWSSNGSYLDDGTQDPDPSASGTATFALSPHSPDTDSTCDYTVTFDNPGDYVLTLTATAVYYETILQGPDKGKATTVSFSGDGNPGMDDPDAAAPASTPSTLQPNAAPSATPNAPASPAKKKIASVAGGKLTGLTVVGATATKSMSTCYVAIVNTDVPPHNVVITASISPHFVGTHLPSGAITWTGGTAGPDQLTRYVSRGMAGTTDVTASYKGKSFTVRIFVVASDALPASTPATLSHTLGGSYLPPVGDFGQTSFTIGADGVVAPKYVVAAYLDGTTWRFRVKSISHAYMQGFRNEGRIDITGPTDPNITPGNKAAIIADLTPPGPNAGSGPPRNYYYSSKITHAHEQAHVDRFYSAPYCPTYMAKFQSDVESYSVEFSCTSPSTQNASDLISALQSGWDALIADYHEATDNKEQQGSEVAAHNVSNPLYTALINAIP